MRGFRCWFGVAAGLMLAGVSTVHGQAAPSAATLQGRLRNRRVEVWIRLVGAATAVGGQR